MNKHKNMKHFNNHPTQLLKKSLVVSHPFHSTSSSSLSSSSSSSSSLVTSESTYLDLKDGRYELLLQVYIKHNDSSASSSSPSSSSSLHPPCQYNNDLPSDLPLPSSPSTYCHGHSRHHKNSSNRSKKERAPHALMNSKKSSPWFRLWLIRAFALPFSKCTSYKRESWAGDYPAEYIESITKKAGNFKKFNTFIDMFRSAMKKTNPNVFIDLLAPTDLAHLKVHPPPSSNTSSSTSSSPSSSSTSEVDPSDSFVLDSLSSIEKKINSKKSSREHRHMVPDTSTSQRRYLILSYTSTFDRVHYPIPLHYQPSHEEPEVLIQFIHTLHQEKKTLQQTLMDQRQLLDNALEEVAYWKHMATTAANQAKASSKRSSSLTTKTAKPSPKARLMSMTNDGERKKGSIKKEEGGRAKRSNSTHYRSSPPPAWQPPPLLSRRSSSVSSNVSTSTSSSTSSMSRSSRPSSLRRLSTSNSSLSHRSNASPSLPHSHSATSSLSWRRGCDRSSSPMSTHSYVPLRSKPLTPFDPTAWVQAHPRRSSPSPGSLYSRKRPPPPLSSSSSSSSSISASSYSHRRNSSSSSTATTTSSSSLRGSPTVAIEDRLRRLSDFLQTARHELGAWNK